MQTDSKPDTYTLATGKAAARRLHLLHNAYGPAGRRVLLKAGLNAGMRVADFGCGVGATTRALAQMVGPEGSAVGIDVSGAQLEQGRELCRQDAIANATFIEASAYSTGLPRDSFDVVYCRFLLLHLTDPATALREMRGVLKPGGVLVVEDGNLMSAGSAPPSALQAFADLFGRLGPTRNVDYAVADRLYHLVKAAGFAEPEIEIHQPALARGEERELLTLSVEEIAPACIAAGLLTAAEMQKVLADMVRDASNPEILVLAPKMSLVWARK